MYNSIDQVIYKATKASLAEIPRDMPLTDAAEKLFHDTELAILFENLERERSNRIKELQQLHPMQIASLILHTHPNKKRKKKQHDEWYILSENQATPLAPIIREIDYLNSKRNTIAVASFIQDLLVEKDVQPMDIAPTKVETKQIKPKRVYIAIQNRSQNTFTDKFGERAKPTSEILGVRFSMDEAKNFIRRMRPSIIEAAHAEGDKEDINFSVTVIDIP